MYVGRARDHIIELICNSGYLVFGDKKRLSHCLVAAPRPGIRYRSRGPVTGAWVISDSPEISTSTGHGHDSMCGIEHYSADILVIYLSESAT